MGDATADDAAVRHIAWVVRGWASFLACVGSHTATPISPIHSMPGSMRVGSESRSLDCCTAQL